MPDVRQSTPTNDCRAPYGRSLYKPVDSSSPGALYSTAKGASPDFGGVRIIDRERAETTKQTFERLAERWVSETRFVSSLDDLVSHSAYRQIIRMGPAAVRFILADLKVSPKPWFYALRQITGADPIPKKAAGNLRKMTTAWLQWGRKRGYR
jgi:hypothetical protein